MLPQIPVVRVTDSQQVPLPRYADGIGTCMILRSSEINSIKVAPNHFEVFSTGIAMALPIGMEAQVRSLKESTETGVIVLNAPVTIDASDRKEIKVCVFNASQESVIIKRGEPIALMVFATAMRIEWQDLTHQIVSKINEQKAENRQKMQQEATQKAAEDAMRPSLIEEGRVNEVPLDTSNVDHLEERPDIIREESQEQEAEMEEFTPIDENTNIEELHETDVADVLIEEGLDSNKIQVPIPEIVTEEAINETEMQENVSAPEIIQEDEEVLSPSIIEETSVDGSPENSEAQIETDVHSAEQNTAMDPIAIVDEASKTYEKSSEIETFDVTDITPPAILESNETEIATPTETEIVTPETIQPMTSEANTMAENTDPEMIMQVTRPNEKRTPMPEPIETEANLTEAYPTISETNLDEPVAPPAILEEFEKIESEYHQNHPEDKS